MCSEKHNFKYKYLVSDQCVNFYGSPSWLYGKYKFYIKAFSNS